MQLIDVVQTVERVRGPSMAPAIVRCSRTHFKELQHQDGASGVLSSTAGGWLLHGAEVIIEPRVEISVERGFRTDSGHD